ncbi:glycosyltransferase family 31 [Geosmithia morbida]|uniref:N-acetylgalactosaminide beta-1,3-galactosyltransferase n=1 Tax=Geosmithia morbida TaxID=1094350 RepID=A0A9P4YSG2_9HYPO|nr:glycosyltransferase family 31 [Geosmithia morbida]KAF4122288.1 glycosyltransferase family 31 [Geosmithia morbida]
MTVSYRNNRIVPAVIIAICLLLTVWLIDPSVEDLGKSVAPKATDSHKAQTAYYYDQEEIQDESTAEDYASRQKQQEEQQREQEQKLKQQQEEDDSSVNQTSSSDMLPDDDDILLIVKTGGTTMWKRLLVHLATTLSAERISPSSIAIYSDNAETIGSFTVIDSLANMSAAVHNSSDFDVYRQQPEYAANNYYVETAGMDGDEWGPVGGWIIDKYKFLPLMQHAGRNWPRAKWYVYMEDDTYLFLPAVRSYLAGFDWRERHYLGSYAAKSDAVFAHGGAGFALSRGAWEASFGKNPRMAEDYHQYVVDHCCGDQVLGLALRDHGVRFGENGGDGKFTWGFNPLVHWTFVFSRSNWCHHLKSFHKVHSRDVARYYEFEKSWDFSKPLLYRDFFNHMILPSIQSDAEWWDNTASQYEVASSTKELSPAPEDGTKYDADLWADAWQSVEACKAACDGWEDCMMWSFVEDLCKMDNRMIMGQGFASSMSQRKTSLMHTSGWMPERLVNWEC